MHNPHHALRRIRRAGAFTALAVLTATGVVSAVPAQAAPSTPAFTWTERQWTVGVLTGALTTASTTFQATGLDQFPDPVVDTGGLLGTILHRGASSLSYLGSDTYRLSVAFDVPATGRSSYSGALQLKSKSRNVGPALPVKVSAAAPGDDLARRPVPPSTDRVATLAGTQQVVEDEVLVAVSFDAADPAKVARAAAAALRAKITGAVPASRLYQLRVPGASVADLPRLAAAAKAVAGVDKAPLNYYDDDPGTVRNPDDSRWDAWDSSSPGGNNWGLEWIHAPEAWDTRTGSADVRVGIIDVGFDPNHSDLNDNISRRSGGDVDAHGTHVSGTACAEGNNGKGISGVAWDCDMRLFLAGSTAAETASDMTDAVDDGNRVVNMSLNYIENGNCDADRALIERLAADANDVFGRPVIYAQREGREVLWTLAAGNECGRDARFTAPGGLGARFPVNTITVAAVGRDGRRAGFSNTGDSVSVAAPGVDIFSTLPRTGCWFGRFSCDDAYGNLDGTSMATPHVTGLAALVMAADPNRSAAQVKNCIVAGAESAGTAVAGAAYHVISAPAAVRCSTLANLPPKVDVVLALDLTGSMGGVLDQAKAEMTKAIGDIKAAAPTTDFRFGVVSYEDYPGAFDSRPCGSSYEATYGDDTDRPFRLSSPMSGDPAVSQAAVNGLVLGSGGDGPESYGRALWELAQADTGASLGWRPDALRLVVNFADNVPHDTNLNEGVTGGLLEADTGVDPGRNGRVDCGEDDIDFQSGALAGLRAAKIRLLEVDTAGSRAYEPYWRHWASLTGGAYTRLGADRSLSEVVIELLGAV